MGSQLPDDLQMCMSYHALLIQKGEVLELDQSGSVIIARVGPGYCLERRQPRKPKVTTQHIPPHTFLTLLQGQEGRGVSFKVAFHLLQAGGGEGLCLKNPLPHTHTTTFQSSSRVGRGRLLKTQLRLLQTGAKPPKELIL